MTVVAYGVGGLLVVIASVIGGTRTATNLLPLVLAALILAVFSVGALLWRFVTLNRKVAEVRRAQSVVATDPAEPPADVASLIGELRRLGFEVVAASDTVIGRNPPIRTWVMTTTGESAVTWVEVVIARTPMAVFISRGGDGRFLETAFPDGAAIDHRNVLARRIESSVDDALRTHLATLAEWTSRAGPPLVVRTLDDYRSVEGEMRERTGGMRISAYLERVVIPGLRNWAINTLIAMATFLVIALLPISRP